MMVMGTIAAMLGVVGVEARADRGMRELSQFARGRDDLYRELEAYKERTVKLKVKIRAKIRIGDNYLKDTPVVRGANDPAIRARMELGKNEHKRIQADSSKCDASEITIGSVRLDCVKVSSNVCTIYEIKPDNDAAKARGREQLTRQKSVQDWTDVMHELVAALRAKHAILGVFDNPDATMSDVAMMGITVNGRSPHPYPRQVGWASVAMGDIGGKYVRHPRWGNYLLPRHLDAVGGLARVRAEVEPHEVREVGELIYVQLTSFGDALTEVCEAKRRALEAILAPILVPERG